jgi:hypothetical protein
MAPLDPAIVFWLLAALHLFGLASVFLTKLPHSHRRHSWFQSLFLASLIFVGAATIFTICVQNHCWVYSGTTFSLMAVGATVDFGPATRAAF